MRAATGRRDSRAHVLCPGFFFGKRAGRRGLFVNVKAVRQYQQTQALASVQSAPPSEREAPRARLSSRVMGFSLGKLGVEFSSSDMELSPSLSPEAVETRRKANAFETERHVEGLRTQLAEQAVADHRNAAEAGAGPSLFSRRRSIAAYVRSASRETPLPGSMMNAAV